MAALGEIPFGQYYGSVDSTPLFVMLAGAYYRRTADQAFIESIWPNIERALRLDRTLRRLGRGRVLRLCPQVAQGLAHTRLEGLGRFGVSRRRHAGRGACRLV